MGKKTALRFLGKKHAKNGIAAVILGGIAWCVCLALCGYSVSTDGNVDLAAGGIGMIDAAAALLGFYAAVKGFKEPDVQYVLPTVGILMNGSLFAIYFILYFIGIS